MELKFIFIYFTLLFLIPAHAACVPRNKLTSAPNPDAPPNLKPVSPAQPGSPKTPISAAAPEKFPTLASTLTNGNVTSGVIDAVMSALPQATGNENPEIKKICNSTEYSDVCLATLGRYNGPTDIPSVLSIAMQAGLDIANLALNTADKLSTQPGTPPDRASLLKDCKDSYDSAAYNIQNAIDAFPAKDVGTMNTMLSAALTDVGDCQDSFEGMDCPVAPFSDKLRKMSSNCLAIILQMKK